jgi:hypothetical protein
MAKLSKLGIVEALKGKCSTDYTCWLSQTLEHIEKYGEEPVMRYIGSSYNHLDLIRGAESVNGRHGLSNENAQILLKDGKAYEIFNTEMYVSECSMNSYLKYVSPMPYNVYIAG